MQVHHQRAKTYNRPAIFLSESRLEAYIVIYTFIKNMPSLFYRSPSLLLYLKPFNTTISTTRSINLSLYASGNLMCIHYNSLFDSSVLLKAVCYLSSLSVRVHPVLTAPLRWITAKQASLKRFPAYRCGSWQKRGQVWSAHLVISFKPAAVWWLRHYYHLSDHVWVKMHGEILHLAVEQGFYCGQEKRLMWSCLFSFIFKGCVREREEEESGKQDSVYSKLTSSNNSYTHQMLKRLELVWFC